MAETSLLLLNQKRCAGCGQTVSKEGAKISKFLIQATWSDCGHLTQEAKDALWASIPDYQKDARSKGVPALGSGAIYKVAESDVTCPDFEIPPHWPRCYGFDVGWRFSAAVWLALNRDTNTIYVYAEHYRSEAEPVIHAEAIKARGIWIPGAIDPAARGRGQIDGRNLLQMYCDLGLNLVAADNAVEAGIYELLTRMTSGRLKIFKSLQNLLGEFRLYRRDEKGRIIKDRDHGLDALRYGHSKLLDIAKCVPAPPPEPRTEYVTVGGYSTGWMG